jgi:hypothetical protein
MVSPLSHFPRNWHYPAQRRPLSNALEYEVREEMSKPRVELSGETGKLRTEMHDLRANFIQWMFVFWIGQIGVFIGLLFTFFRK